MLVSVDIVLCLVSSALVYVYRCRQMSVNMGEYKQWQLLHMTCCSALTNDRSLANGCYQAVTNIRQRWRMAYRWPTADR